VVSKTFSDEGIEKSDLLPRGWVQTGFEEIGIVNPRSIEKEISDDSDVSFVPMRCVNEMGGGMDVSIVKKYLDVKKGYTPFIDGDLLIAKITPCMENGKVVIAEKLKNGVGFGSTEFHNIRFRKEIAKSLYYYYFLRADIRKDAQRHMTGTAGQLRVPSSFIQNLQVPLPPIPEQHRIVTKIEELLTQLDAGVFSLKKTQEQLKRYRQAVLKAAFKGRLTQEWREEHEGEIESVKILFEKIRQEKNIKGYPKIGDGRNQPDSNEYPHEWIFIRLDFLFKWTNGDGLSKNQMIKGDFTVYGGNGITGTHNKWISEKEAIVIGRVGAHCGNVNLTKPKSWITDNAIFSSWYSKHIYLKFYLYALKNHKLNQLSGGSGQPYLSQSILNRLYTCLPPYLEQIEIANEIERYFSQIDHLEEIIKTSLRQAESLRQSILKRAFEGKLVPQDPNDEPASVLLERIKAEKARYTAEMKKGKTLQPKSPKRKIKNGN